MKPFLSLIFLLITSIAFTQNVVIDYEDWDPESTTSSLFVSPTKFSNNKDSFSGAIEHQRILGRIECHCSFNHMRYYYRLN